MSTSTPSTRSITEQKSAFLRSQIRMLGTSLQPSPFWQEPSRPLPPSPSTSEPAPTPNLGEKALAEIVAKLNAKLKSHNRLVFSTPSQRHVAEQIDALYWAEITAHSRSGGGGDDRGEGEEETVWIVGDTDLTRAESVRALPDASSLPLQPENEVQREKYEVVKKRVGKLVGRRDELAKKVSACQELRRLVAPFEHVKADVQPNLVGRDGDLAREMERMRVLVARVGAGLEARAERKWGER